MIKNVINFLLKNVMLVYMTITMLLAIVLTSYFTRYIDKKECSKKIENCNLKCKKENEEQKKYYLQSLEDKKLEDKKLAIDDIYISVEIIKKQEQKNDINDSKTDADDEMNKNKLLSNFSQNEVNKNEKNLLKKE